MNILSVVKTPLFIAIGSVVVLSVLFLALYFGFKHPTLSTDAAPSIEDRVVEVNTSKSISNIQSGIETFVVPATPTTPAHTVSIPASGNRTYTDTVTITKSPDGTETANTKLTISSQGQTITVPLSNSRFILNQPKPSFSFWNPRVFIGVGGTFAPQSLSGDVVPNVAFSPFSYGKYKAEPDLFFATVGVGYGAINHTAVFSIAPVSVKVPLNILHNTYISPSVGIDTNKNFNVGIDMQVGL